MTSYGVRLPIFGDGESDRLKIDLRETLFLMGEGNNYQLIPMEAMPHRVLHVVVGGPSITPESQQQVDTTAELEGYELTLNFSHALLQLKEAYTVEIVFGKLGIPPELPEFPESLEPGILTEEIA
jgi:hypothetical protein